MLNCCKYPAMLEGLGLSFEESIYAIVFNLADEIRQNGKEVVFDQLSCREEMSEKVQKLLNKLRISETDHYVLRKVLSFTPINEDDPILKNDSAFLQYCSRYDAGVKQYASDTMKCLLDGMFSEIRIEKCRYMLADMSRPRVLPETDTGEVSTQNISAIDVVDLCMQVQRLVEEMNFYDQKRKQTLLKIETLLAEVKKKSDPALDVENSADAEPKAPFDVQKEVTQIYWSYRSHCVLQELGINILAKAVEYFSNFDNFVNGESSITLWEWSAIVSVLCQEGLISTEGRNTLSPEDPIEWLLFRSGARTYNCLKRDGIWTIWDLMSVFAHGAKEGWMKFARLRSFGQRSMLDLTQTMSSCLFIVPSKLYSPTIMSDIRALDFDKKSLRILSDICQIKTIDELIMACCDENRFCGLRYFNESAYNVAMEHLKKYGFCAEE